MSGDKTTHERRWDEHWTPLWVRTFHTKIFPIKKLNCLKTKQDFPKEVLLSKFYTLPLICPFFGQLQACSQPWTTLNGAFESLNWLSATTQDAEAIPLSGGTLFSHSLPLLVYPSSSWALWSPTSLTNPNPGSSRPAFHFLRAHTQPVPPGIILFSKQQYQDTLSVHGYLLHESLSFQRLEYFII